MGKAVMSLTKEKATTAGKLRRVEELECLLAEARWRLAVENATMDFLMTEVVDKGKQLQATLAQEADLVA